jgi:hypothetical protein
MAWFFVHLPFIMCFVLSSSALGVLVRAHDCPDAPVDSLYETFIPRSEEHISDGLRWFYCGGLGISLACMTIISISHVHKKIPHQRLSKHVRISVRFAVSLVILLLPLAHLNSLELVSTTTGLVLFVLFMELWGATCTGQNILWENKCGRDKSEYLAKCSVSKKELVDSMKGGKVINVEEIAKRDVDEKGVIGGV